MEWLESGKVFTETLNKVDLGINRVQIKRSRPVVIEINYLHFILIGMIILCFISI